jgi:hypothetical protein
MENGSRKQMAKTLAQKSLVKSGYQIQLINAPDGFAIDGLPTEVSITTDEGKERDMVYLFVNSIADVQQLAPQAIKALKYDGLLWIAYPKRSSSIKTDINCDNGWETLDAAGFRPVTQISIDDTWSALRFRPKAEVK